jgi:ribosome production factor 2
MACLLFRKPKNARSKRALDARAPKEVEDPRTCLFIKGTKTGEILNGVMKDMVRLKFILYMRSYSVSRQTALKRPYAISFNKKNEIRPFEESDPLSFLSQKNDASTLLVAQTTKKRPDNLTLCRTFDGRVLDLLELGVENFIPMTEFKVCVPLYCCPWLLIYLQGTKCTPGHRPLLHFASDLFDAHPALTQLKSHFLCLFASPNSEPIHLSGIEHVISITLGPPSSTVALSEDTPTSDLPKVHIRVYTLTLRRSGVRIPNVSLTPMGPAVDVRIRRTQAPDAVLLKESLKRPKLAKKDVEKGVGKKKKNLEVDEMGDLRGRVHVTKQDLGKLQTRKMKGLKRDAEDESDGDDEDDEASDGIRKRRRT